MISDASNVFDSVPNFTFETAKSVFYTDCMIAKKKPARIDPSNRVSTRPLEWIHMELLGAMRTTYMGIISYALGILYY